jgi:3-methyl-2-oxobutanoate hydroxymethyltransferase
MNRRPTVHDLHRAKGTTKWVQLHVYTPAEAAAAVEAGIVILSCEPDHHLEGIRREAPHAFVSVGMPHGAVAAPHEAVRLAFDLLHRGADAVYCSHSPSFIEAMARESIPVTGHVGLVPNKAAWTGFRAIGRTADEALRVLRDARDIESAGAAFLEVEVVPVELADHLTRATHMVTMGMGCGDACDTQYLFSCDVLGTNTGHYPRHSKRYDDFAAVEVELHHRRVAALQTFVADVTSGGYPTRQHEVHMEEAEFERFAERAAALG